MRIDLSARSRLTLLYMSLFGLGGAALVAITYVLVVHTLDSATTTRIPPSIQPAIGKCVLAAQTQGGPGALNQCARLYASGVEAGTSAQRGATLAHLLTYSLLSLVSPVYRHTARRGRRLDRRRTHPAAGAPAHRRGPRRE